MVRFTAVAAPTCPRLPPRWGALYWLLPSTLRISVQHCTKCAQIWSKVSIGKFWYVRLTSGAINRVLLHCCNTTFERRKISQIEIMFRSGLCAGCVVNLIFQPSAKPAAVNAALLPIPLWGLAPSCWTLMPDARSHGGVWSLQLHFSQFSQLAYPYI